MDELPTHNETSGELLARLDDLEAEVARLRTAVATARDDDAPRLPTSSFHALRLGLGDDTYGVPIDWVREIVRYVELTRIADVPEFVAGTINFRGEILPVIDGRARFGLPSRPPRRGTAIVLLRVGRIEAGLVVDGVRDVAHVASGTLQTPGGPLSTAHGVAALTAVEGEIVQLLDISRLLSRQQWESVQLATSTAPSTPEPDEPAVPTDDSW